jgi:hypothetical protein
MKETKVTAAAALKCTVRRGKTLRIYWLPNRTKKEGDVWVIDTFRKSKGVEHKVHIQITDESLNILMEARYRMKVLGEGKPKEKKK